MPMRVFYFTIAAAAALGLTVMTALGYPALVAIFIEAHEPWTLYLVQDFGPLVLILALWAGLVGTFFVTRPEK